MDDCLKDVHRLGLVIKGVEKWYMSLWGCEIEVHGHVYESCLLVVFVHNTD